MGVKSCLQKSMKFTPFVHTNEMRKSWKFQVHSIIFRKVIAISNFSDNRKLAPRAVFWIFKIEPRQFALFISSQTFRVPCIPGFVIGKSWFGHYMLLFHGIWCSKIWPKIHFSAKFCGNCVKMHFWWEFMEESW